MSLPVEFLCSRKFSPLNILFVQRYFIQMMFSESSSSQDQCSQQKMKYNSGGVMLESVEKCEVEKLLYFPWWERCRCWRGSDASTHDHWSIILINIWSASYSSFSENKILSFSKCRGRHPRTWSCEFELVSRVELLHPSSAAQQTHDMLSGALLQVDWSSGNWILCSELVRIEVGNS